MSPSIPNHLPIETNVHLAPRTTLQIGGAARYFATPSHQNELIDCIRWAQQYELPIWFLGGGSNVVIADTGLPGLVIQYRANTLQLLEATANTLQVRVDAGFEWDRFVAWSVEQDAAGIECLSGIPGHVGAAPIQNIGAYGQEVSETIVSVDVLDLADRNITSWTPEQCRFSYRHSALKERAKGSYLITNVVFQLRPQGPASLRYAELQRQFPNGKPRLQEVRQKVLQLRQQKSMVIDPEDPNSRSAGSFFTNPILPKAQVAQVRKCFEAQLREGEHMPQYPAREGYSKLSAAWLIDRSGLQKGYGSGRVGLSQNHTLALVNRGQATANELVEFASFVQKHVYDFCGVFLIPEPILLGFPKNITSPLYQNPN